LTLAVKQAVERVEKMLESFSSHGGSGRIEVIVENGAPTYIWKHEGDKINPCVTVKRAI
jgi:hypothetical protein